MIVSKSTALALASVAACAHAPAASPGAPDVLECLGGNCRDGVGEAWLRYRGAGQVDGRARYVGEFAAGRPHGRGVIHDAARGRLLYDGTFEHGEQTGVATALVMSDAVCSGGVSSGVPHGVARCEYASGGAWRGRPQVVRYAGEYVAGRPHGSGQGTLRLGDASEVTFVGSWRGGPREGELRGAFDGTVAFDDDGRVRWIAAPSGFEGSAVARVRGTDAARWIAVTQVRQALPWLWRTQLRAVPGCMAGDCEDGEGVQVLDEHTLVAARFSRDRVPFVYARASVEAYERGGISAGWLLGHGQRRWRGTDRVDEGWFVAGRFVGTSDEVSRRLRTGPDVQVQRLVGDAERASNRAVQALQALQAFGARELRGTGVTDAVRAALVALIAAARAAAVEAQAAWEAGLPDDDQRELAPAMAQHRAAHVADVVALDVALAAARTGVGAVTDGRDVASAVRQTLEAIATGGRAHAAARAALAQVLDVRWRATLRDERARLLGGGATASTR